MPKVSRTFRIDRSLSEAMDKIYIRHGDNTYHLEAALSQYGPIKAVINHGVPVVKKAVSKEVGIPDGINQPAWNEWAEYRKSKKKTISPAAAKKQFKLLANHAFDVQQQIIDQSISNDYQGLFEPKGNGNENNKRPNQAGRPSVVDRVKHRNEEREQARRVEERALDGQAMGAVARNIRPPAQQPIRGNDSGELGATVDGYFTRAD